MTDHKFTDEEVIKALDICGHFEACADCVLGDLGGIDKCYEVEEYDHPTEKGGEE